MFGVKIEAFLYLEKYYAKIVLSISNLARQLGTI